MGLAMQLVPGAWQGTGVVLEKAGACSPPAESNVLDSPGCTENQTLMPPSGYAEGDIFNLYLCVVVPDQ